MTREELKAHCEKQIEMCEFWAIGKGEKKPSGRVYEEHKLILELLEQETVSKESYDHEYFLRKELEMKIAKLEHDKNVVLDKIKKDVKKWYWQADKQRLAEDPCVVDAMIDLFIRTINKYKAESEPQENDKTQKSCKNCRSFQGHAGHCDICNDMSMYKESEG